MKPYRHSALRSAALDPKKVSLKIGPVQILCDLQFQKFTGLDKVLKLR